MKIPKTHFERFKKEFNRWVAIFGLTQYRIEFRFEKDGDNYASIQTEEEAKAALVILANVIRDKSELYDPEVHAKHEAIHLLVHRLRWLGGCRYIDSEELNEECETLVRRLEKVL